MGENPVEERLSGLRSEKRIVSSFLTDGGGWAMSREYPDVVVEREQLGLNPIEQQGLVPTRKIPSSNPSVEKDISSDEGFGWRK